MLTAKRKRCSIQSLVWHLNDINMGGSSLKSACAVNPTGAPAMTLHSMPFAAPPHMTMNAQPMNWFDRSPKWPHGSPSESISES